MVGIHKIPWIRILVTAVLIASITQSLGDVYESFMVRCTSSPNRRKFPIGAVYVTDAFSIPSHYVTFNSQQSTSSFKSFFILRMAKGTASTSGSGRGIGTGSSISTKGFGKINENNVKSYNVDVSDKIQQLEQFLSFSSTTTTTTSSTAAAVPTIICKNRADLSNVEVGVDKSTGRRGLYAANSIGKDKIICKIPSDFLLALDNPMSLNNNDIVDNSNDFRENIHREQMAIVQCGLYYLNTYLNNPDTYQQWMKYIDTIPKSIDPMSATPDLYEDDEIELLEFPRIVQCVLDRKRTIKQVASEQNISVEQLQYATWLVSTRSFPITIANSNNSDNSSGSSPGEIQYDDRGQVLISKESGSKVLRVLAPYIDIVNHSSPRQANARRTILDPNKDDAWFALESTRPIAAGKEITIPYGSLSTSLSVGSGTGGGTTLDLFLNYGFIYEDDKDSENIDSTNPIDALMVKKGGDDCYTRIDQWTTSIQEDIRMLEMIQNAGTIGSTTSTSSSNLSNSVDINLTKILQFRIRLKNSYQG